MVWRSGKRVVSPLSTAKSNWTPLNKMRALLISYYREIQFSHLLAKNRFTKNCLKFLCETVAGNQQGGWRRGKKRGKRGSSTGRGGGDRKWWSATSTICHRDIEALDSLKTTSQSFSSVKLPHPNPLQILHQWWNQRMQTKKNHITIIGTS